MRVLIYLFGMTAFYYIVFASNEQNVVTNSGCYGDIMKLSPTGTSKGGVKGSIARAKNDKKEIEKRLSSYSQTAVHTCMDPALIAALASRESNAGSALYRTKGYGDYHDGKYHAYGILQCDLYHSGINCTKYLWDSQENMEMLIKSVFLKKLTCVKQKMPNWPKEHQLQGAVAAYNFGCSNVQSWANLDKGTTGNDYSNDVMARAQWIKQNIPFQ